MIIFESSCLNAFIPLLFPILVLKCRSFFTAIYCHRCFGSCHVGMGLSPGSQRFQAITPIPSRCRGYVLPIVWLPAAVRDLQRSLPMHARPCCDRLWWRVSGGPSSNLINLLANGDVALIGTLHGHHT